MQLARFESILDAADAALEVALERRGHRSSPPADNAEGNLQLVLATVYATCEGAGPPPQGDASQNELLTWTVQAITNARNNAVRATAAKGSVPGMDPQHVETCMELMQKLNQVMGGGRL